jgi:hypothetical protein
VVFFFARKRLRSSEQGVDMPSQIVELVDVEQTVTRPVVMAIMEQIFEITSLSRIPTFITAV